MVVIAKKVGRLANRILLFAQFIGTAAEHGFTVANPAFCNYARYFPTTARDLFCRFPRRVSIPAPRPAREAFYRLTLVAADFLARRQRRGREVGLIRLQRDQYLDLESPAFHDRRRRHRMLLVQDWFFRSPENCAKHRDTIRAYFTPYEHHLVRSRALLAAARCRGRFLVGVHVRQGDYAQFKGGRYFYSPLQYRALMEKARRAFAGRDVAFLLCSDAPAPAAAFGGLDVHFGNGHELEELYALAGCDRLLGPPSTYGKWASYYGGVPRYEVFDPAAELGPESFHVDTALSVKRLPEAGGSV